MPKYLLRAGEIPGVAIWSRCEDELLCRAELVLLLGRQPEEGTAVFGYYEVDRRHTIAEFKRAYKGRSDDYRELMAARQNIIENGWPYPVAMGGVGRLKDD